MLPVRFMGIEMGIDRPLMFPGTGLDRIFAGRTLQIEDVWQHAPMVRVSSAFNAVHVMQCHQYLLPITPPLGLACL